MAKKNKATLPVELSVRGGNALFKTDNDLATQIDNYFMFILGSGEYKLIKTPHGTQYDQWVWKVKPVPPTITGLAYFLGFESRQSFYDYEKNGSFSYTLKRARLFIESKYEEQLWTSTPTGAIFALKNLGWREQPIEEDKAKLNIIIE